jgi:hypothetical protein
MAFNNDHYIFENWTGIEMAFENLSVFQIVGSFDELKKVCFLDPH